MSDAPSRGSDSDRLSELRASAKGRPGVQMAVPAGQLRIIADGSPVSVGLQAVSSLRSVDSC